MRTRLTTLAPLFLLAGCRSLTTPDATPTPVPDTTLHAPAPRPQAAAVSPVGENPGHAGQGTTLAPAAGHALAAFAAGCFWGVEDAFRKVPGVTHTAVGYTGGHTKDPTYEIVCDHESGHAETVLVEYDPAKVRYESLITVFFRIHDPTTMNRQGPDVGDQYRSAIFTFSPAQEVAARAGAASAETKLGARVVTQIAPIGPFYKAEGYHQQYAEKTGHHGCAVPGATEGI